MLIEYDDDIYHMILKRLDNLKTFINPLSYGVANSCDELGFVYILIEIIIYFLY